MGRRGGRRVTVAGIAALAIAASALLIGAPAASASPSTTALGGARVTLDLESPAKRSTVADTTEFVYSGTGLTRVELFAKGRSLGSATVSADGTSAVAVVDTVLLRDGWTPVVAFGWGSKGRWPSAVETVVVKVDNAHGDGHPAGATLIFGDDFSGSSLDTSAWCTRMPWWEPTSQPSQEEIVAIQAVNPDCITTYPLTDSERGKTTSVLDQYATEADKAAAAGETDIAAWYTQRRVEIAANTGVVINGDGSYDLSGMYDPTYGTLDTLGGWDIRPRPDAPEWELPQEEEVYRDVNSEGDPTHTVQDGYLSLIVTKTRTEAPVLQYESGLVRSEQEFLTSWDAPLYLTARVRAPEVLGTFPAFWMMDGLGSDELTPGWPPEIDIFEQPYNNDGSYPSGDRYGDIFDSGVQTYLCEEACGPATWFDITNPYDPGNGDHEGFAVEGGIGDFHSVEPSVGTWIEIGVAWYPDRVCFFHDGEQFACETYRWGEAGTAADGPLSQPATLILNQAFGGRWAGYNGEEDDRLPASFDVDHVRVYQLPATSAEQLTPLP